MNSRMDNNFKFVIVGGGSAGWITALFVKKQFPLSNITVIQSSEIGILGAGEGTTPHIIDFLDEIDIPVSDLVKHAKATIKNGIRFSNWNGDNNHYYHAFPDNYDLDHTLISKMLHTDYPLLDLEQIANNKSISDISFNALACERNCVRFIPDSTAAYKDLDPILHFKRLGNIALHFDANELAVYLEKVGRSRGIEVIDDVVTNITVDDQEYIKSIVCRSTTVHGDFIFDCSGFKRLIIGNFYKSTWISYKKHLPVKKAMPFFIQNPTNIIPPYTDSVAMKWGWMWRIPVQGRYGCGYVFDSNRVSNEDAKKEIDNILGVEVDIPRVIDFDPGRFEKIFIKNCMAVGLSTGFIEPLEATSIWTSIMMLQSLMKNIGSIVNRDQLLISKINKRFSTLNDNTLGFVYFHYITTRKDTEFWSRFTIDNEIPTSILDLLEQSKNVVPSYDDFNEVGADWGLKSFYACGNGQQFFNPVFARKIFDTLNTGQRKVDYQIIKNQYFKNLNLNLSTLIDHYSFLEYLKNN
jgi:tryptophan halogenase